MSTHNICFYTEIRKNIPELSPNTPPKRFLCISLTKLCCHIKCLLWDREDRHCPYCSCRQNQTLLYQLATGLGDLVGCASDW